MGTRRSTLTIILSLLSACGSFCFIFFGLSVVLSTETLSLAWFFAYLVIGCGLLNFGILSWAWQKGGTGSLQAVKFLASGFMVVFSVGSLGTKLLSGSQTIIIAGVGIVLLINWLAIRQIVCDGQNTPSGEKKPAKGKALGKK